MAENTIWLSTIGAIVLLSIYGTASYAAIPWV
jgi:hypothetical protein